MTLVTRTIVECPYCVKTGTFKVLSLVFPETNTTMETDLTR